MPISVKRHQEWSPASGSAGMTSTSPLCTMQPSGTSDRGTHQIQIEFKYMVHHQPPCLSMSRVTQARSPHLCKDVGKSRKYSLRDLDCDSLELLGELRGGRFGETPLVTLTLT